METVNIAKQSRTEVQKIGTEECPFRKPAGSYYAPEPWDTCSKMPSPASNENGMCDIDAGVECRYADEC